MREEPRGREADDLDDVLRLRKGAGSAVEHVQHRRAHEAGNERGDDREQAGQTRRAPCGEQEANRQGYLEGADVAGNMYGKAGVVAEHESRQSRHELYQGDGNQRDAEGSLVTRLMPSPRSDGRQDGSGEIRNSRGASKPRLTVHGGSIARERTARGAAPEMGFQLDGIDAEVLTVETCGDRGTGCVALHALIVDLRAVVVPR
jgi:hypothetical protein